MGEQELNEVKCEDVLSKKVCDELKAAAKKLKVKVEEIDAFIRQLVKEKITKAEEIIKRVRAKLVELAKNFHCTDVLSAKMCKGIEDLAKVIEVKMAVVEKVIKEIVVKGVTDIKKIIHKIIEHFFPHH